MKLNYSPFTVIIACILITSKVAMSSSYDNEGSFCNDYLLLNPEKVSLFDLIRFLVSKDLVETGDFLRRPDGVAAADDHLKRVRYRWEVFISIVAQKIFLGLKSPVGRLGSWLEEELNLVSINGGLHKLIFNTITGNVIRPVESCANFRSMVGNLDVRVDLEHTIHPKDQNQRYLVHLSLMASKLAYENSSFAENVVTNHWQMRFLHFYDFWNAFQQRYTTQAFVFKNSVVDPDLYVISFRGTKPFDMDNWCTDVDISWCSIKGVGMVHGGFMKALGLPRNMDWTDEVDPAQQDGPSAYYTLRNLMREINKENKNAKFMITGHSLGGALAILLVGMLIVHGEKELLESICGVNTFGQPRVGDAQFGEYMKANLRAYNVSYRRFVYLNDAVPRLPYDDKLMLFKHFGPCLFFNSLYKGKVLSEEPNKNYFSLLWVLPKYLNAYWELARGVTYLPLVQGKEYGEGWCLRAFRLIGLVMPGLSAHGPQDYDNITRIGTMVDVIAPDLQTKDSFKLD